MTTEVIHLRLSKLSGAATNEELVALPVPENAIDRVVHIAVEDETTACTYLRVGILRGATYHWHLEQKSPAAATLYHTDEPIDLAYRDVLVTRFNGSTSGDVLTAYATIRRRWLRRRAEEV